MPYVVTLTHVRYCRQRLDLGELKHRLEIRIAARGAPKLQKLLVHTNRLIALMDYLDSGRAVGDVRKRMDNEFAFLLLDFDQVLAIMAGGARRRAPSVERPAITHKPAPRRR